MFFCVVVFKLSAVVIVLYGSWLDDSNQSFRCLK